MKNRIPPILTILVIGLILAACGSSQATPATSGVIAAGNDVSNLTVSEKLAIGTLKLKDTGQAVDATQAAALLPLWKAAQSLSSSDTISSKEMDALYVQIQDTMTADQMKSINAMEFTSDDLDQLMSDLGVGAGAETSSTSSTGSSSSGMPSGGSGMPPDAGGMPVGGDAGGFTPPSSASNQSGSSTGQSPTQVSPVNVFIEPLITMLKEKAASLSG
jgi:hypothetical protein